MYSIHVRCRKVLYISSLVGYLDLANACLKTKNLTIFKQQFCTICRYSENLLYFMRTIVDLNAQCIWLVYCKLISSCFLSPLWLVHFHNFSKSGLTVPFHVVVLLDNCETMQELPHALDGKVYPRGAYKLLLYFNFFAYECSTVASFCGRVERGLQCV